MSNYIKILFLGIVSFLVAQSGDSYWMAEGSDEPPVVSLHAGPGFSHNKAIILIFRDGRVIWSEEYFAIPYQDKNYHFYPHYTWRIKENKTERLKLLKEYLNASNPDDPQKVDRWIEHMSDDFEGNGETQIVRQILSEGYVEPEVVQRLIDQLYEFEIHTDDISRGAPMNTVWTSFNFRDRYVSSGDLEGTRNLYTKNFNETEFLSKGPLKERKNKREVWDDFISYILSIRDKVDPATIASIDSDKLKHTLFGDYEIDYQFNSLRTKESLINPKRLYDEEESDRLSKQANIHYRNGQTTAALTLLEANIDIIMSEPDRARFYEMMGMLHLRADRYTEAFKAFQNSLRFCDFPSANVLLRRGYMAARAPSRGAALRNFGMISFDTGPIYGTEDELIEARVRSAIIARILSSNVPKENLQLLIDDIEARPITHEISGWMNVHEVVFAFEQAKGNRWYRPEPEEKKQLFKKARRLADAFLYRHDTKPEDRIVVELMLLESYYYEKKYQQCIDTAKIYINKWKDYNFTSGWKFRRQVSMAHCYVMFSLFELGHYEETIVESQKIRKTYNENDYSTFFNIFGYSLLYEGVANEALDQYSKANASLRECKKNYPHWSSTWGDHVDDRLRRSVRDLEAKRRHADPDWKKEVIYR
jgi:tetratricopeptide (TPR) repeat protein